MNLYRGITLTILSVYSFSLLAQSPATGRGASINIKWMSQYIGKSSSDLASDKRFKPTIKALLPTRPPLPLTQSTADAAVEYMAQGQGLIQAVGSSLVVNGCEPHACSVSGGWLWVDSGSASPEVMLALLQPAQKAPNAAHLPFSLILIGNHLQPEKYLSQAGQQHLTAWLKSMKAVNIVDFEVESPAGKQKMPLPDNLHLD